MTRGIVGAARFPVGGNVTWKHGEGLRGANQGQFPKKGKADVLTTAQPFKKTAVGTTVLGDMCTCSQ